MVIAEAFILQLGYITVKFVVQNSFSIGDKW